MTPDASKVELAAKYHGTVSWQFSNQFHNDDSMHTTDRTSPWSIIQLVLFQVTDGMDIVCGRSASARVAAFHGRNTFKWRDFSTESPYQPWGSTVFVTHNRAKLDRMGWQSTCFGNNKTKLERHWKTWNNTAGEMLLLYVKNNTRLWDNEIMRINKLRHKKQGQKRCNGYQFAQHWRGIIRWVCVAKHSTCNAFHLVWTNTRYLTAYSSFNDESHFEFWFPLDGG